MMVYNWYVFIPALVLALMAGGFMMAWKLERERREEVEETMRKMFEDYQKEIQERIRFEDECG